MAVTNLDYLNRTMEHVHRKIHDRRKAELDAAGGRFNNRDDLMPKSLPETGSATAEDVIYATVRRLGEDLTVMGSLVFAQAIHDDLRAAGYLRDEPAPPPAETGPAAP